MRDKRFSEEQTLQILKDGEKAGPTNREACWRHGISEFTYYRWRKKFGGMSVLDAKRLKDLEKENGKLKNLLANRDLEVEALKELLRKHS